MKTVTKIISYILSFILMLTLFTTIILNIFTNTILNTDYILAKIEKTDYYDTAYTDFISQIEDYIEQSGLEEVDTQNIIKKEEVKTNIQNFFIDIFSGKETSSSKSALEEQLTNNLKEELAQKGKTLTNAEQKAVKSVITTIAEKYQSEIIYNNYSSYINYIPKAISKANKYIPTAKIALLISTIILIAFILILNCKQLKNGIKYIGISGLAIGILMLFINIFIKSRVDIPNFFILNKAISNLISNITLNILSKINIAGIISSIIGIVLIIFGATHKINKE